MPKPEKVENVPLTGGIVQCGAQLMPNAEVCQLPKDHHESSPHSWESAAVWAANIHKKALDANTAASDRLIAALDANTKAKK